MRHTSPRQFIKAALLLTLLAAAGCRQTPRADSSAGTPARERVAGTRGGTISVRLTSLPKTFNPLMVGDESSLLVCLYLLNSRLIDFDHDTQSYVSALAEQWKTGADGRTVEMTLRDGAKFSDGSAMTSDDVLFTLRALYDARTGSPLIRDAMMVGGRPVEATATDARHLRLVFPEKVAAPESYLVNLSVLPHRLLEEEFNQGKIGSAWDVATDPQRIITCGPFVVDSIQPGERLRLRRNPHYWKRDRQGVQLPYLDGLTLEALSDANQTLLRLGQGAIDLADRVRPSDFAALQSSQGVNRATDLGPGLSTDHLWFNLNQGARNGQPIVSPVRRAWFNDVRFRRAISHAIDRESIARTVLRGLATPLYGFVSPGNRAWVAKDLPRTDYSLDRARALLQEAGFVLRASADAPELSDGQGNRVEFTLLVQAENELRKQMATVIQQDLARLGIRMQIATLDAQGITERWAKTFDYDAVLMGLTLTDPEPSSYLNFLRSDSATHHWFPGQTRPATEWEAQVDKLIAAQAVESDLPKRQALFREIQRIMAEQLPVIPIVARHIVSVAGTRIGNYRPDGIFPYSLWNVDELFVRH